MTTDTLKIINSRERDLGDGFTVRRLLPAIGRKMAIRDDMQFQDQHWFRKVGKKRHYEWLVIVSSAQGQVEKRVRTSYHLGHGCCKHVTSQYL